ncbi:hypothetical protein BCY91_03920 [Pelobium manganitolerans]|uniref:Uncharacterized protein n=1 Tax=Pelobium manganitolerans TaxID=1842495 RepID=A0A419S7H5_9SPHI|nr:hypothetical protein [Pelobium manganitolerans]RKD17284.1 hypothetical protein BCY91_03920 [Pelobium manganitolerans]
MFEKTFPFSKVGHDRTHNKKYLIEVFTYNFKADRTWYLVEVEHYQHNIYILKFYLKKHKKHPNKYNMMSGEFQCARVIATCLKILLKIYFDNPLASFGFIGANTIQPDRQIYELKSNTKRFRVYQTMLTTKIGKETFTHFHNVSKSTYLMANNLVDVGKLKKNAEIMFSEEFPEL